jgi:hypothetical protein
VEIALREAVANAIIRGNHENPRKHVHVRWRCEPDEVSIAVKDEGRGFEINKRVDPTAPENIGSVHGRGIYLMKALMDEVSSKRVGLLFTCERALAKLQPRRHRRTRRGRLAFDLRVEIHGATPCGAGCSAPVHGIVAFRNQVCPFDCKILLVLSKYFRVHEGLHVAIKIGTDKSASIRQPHWHRRLDVKRPTRRCGTPRARVRHTSTRSRLLAHVLSVDGVSWEWSAQQPHFRQSHIREISKLWRDLLFQAVSF